MSLQNKIAAAISAAVSLHMLAWLAMFSVLVGIVFLALGVFLLITPPLDPGFAALVVGGGLIGMIVVIVLIGLLIARIRSKRQRTTFARRNPDNFIEEQLRPVIGDRAIEWTRAHSHIAAAAALSAGVLIAASPALRRMTISAVRPLVSRRTLEFLQDVTENRR